jgi:hypothetical protein
VLITAVLVFLAEAVWFVVNLPGPVGPPLLGSLPPFVLALLILFAYRRAAATPGIAPAVRRFWRTMALSGTISVLTLFADFPAYLRGPVPPPNPVSSIMHTLTVGLVLVALYRLPLGARSRTERMRLMLDVATVTLAAVLFAWYFSFSDNPSAQGDRQALTTTIMCTLIAIAVLAVVKVIMSGSQTMDPIVLRLFGAALCVEVVGMLAKPVLAGREHIATEPLGRTAMYVFPGAGPSGRSACCRTSPLPAWTGSCCTS